MSLSLTGPSAETAAKDYSAVPERPPVFIDLMLRPETLFLDQRALLSWKGKLLVMFALGLAVILERKDRLAPLFDLGLLASAATLTGGALLAGAIQWFVGGGLFKARIWLSGARRPDSGLARAIFGRTAAIMAATLVFASLLDALPGRDPSESWFSLVYLGVVAWSGFAGYRGVVSAFPVSRRKARVWFLFFPALILIGYVVKELRGLV